MSTIIPNISVDCVVLGFDGQELNALLIERHLMDEKGATVFKDHTLTGYHIKREQNLDEAAAYILKELTGLPDIYLEQVFTFGDTQRLMCPKDQEWIKHQELNIDNRTITIVYYSLIDNTKVQISDNRRKATWFPIKELPELGFDHKLIVEKTLEYIRLKARLEPIVFELLPEKFTLTQLQKAYEAVLNTAFDRRNFRKKIQQLKYIIPLNEKQKGVSHKPAQLFFFSKEVYELTKKDRFVI